MRFGGFIITFNRPAILKQTIETILNQTQPPEVLLILDNGRSPETEHVVRSFSNPNVRYEPMRENLGPAGAAAIGLKRISELGYDWIYWVDDDNPPMAKDILERVTKIVESVAGDDLGGVAAVGTRWDWKKGEFKRVSDDELHGIVDVDAIGGNQQLMIRKSMLEKVGLPDPRLFFGLEEIEYCLRIRRAGYRLIVDRESMRDSRKLAGRLNLQMQRSVVPRYPYQSLWRRYYTSRNYIFFMRNTFHRPSLAYKETLKAATRSTASWKHGPKYAFTFTIMQLRGILDGFRNRMGRTVVPVSAPSRNKNLALS